MMSTKEIRLSRNDIGSATSEGQGDGEASPIASWVRMVDMIAAKKKQAERNSTRQETKPAEPVS